MFKATTGGLWSSSPPISQTLCHWSNSITNLWLLQWHKVCELGGEELHRPPVVALITSVCLHGNHPSNYGVLWKTLHWMFYPNLPKGWHQKFWDFFFLNQFRIALPYPTLPPCILRMYCIDRPECQKAVKQLITFQLSYVLCKLVEVA